LACHLLEHLAPSFFFTAPATSATYTLSLHDALPIFHQFQQIVFPIQCRLDGFGITSEQGVRFGGFLPVEQAEGVLGQQYLMVLRSEEHTSELQSRENLVCRLLLEKKKIRRHGSRLPP